MNTAKHVVCVFPHGKDDFSSTDKLVKFLSVTLPQKRRGKYYLRNLGRTRRFDNKSFIEAVNKGSFTIFRMQGKIWGVAFVNKGIVKSSDCPPYRFTISFNPKAIKVYRNGIDIKDIERVTRFELTKGWLRASYLILGYSDNIEPKLMGIMDLPVRP